jgi:hypothetical protein
MKFFKLIFGFYLYFPYLKNVLKLCLFIKESIKFNFYMFKNKKYFLNLFSMKYI